MEYGHKPASLPLSHSLILSITFHISHTPCICGYLFTECLFDGLKPFHFVSPHSMLAQIRAASSPMFSFRHQIRIFIRYFFFSCVYTVILASQRTCTRPKRICWSNGVECVAVQYFDVISIWIWNIDSYEHWAITRTTFFISRWCITVLLTEYLLTIFSSFF